MLITLMVLQQAAPLRFVKGKGENMMPQELRNHSFLMQKDG